MPFPIIAVVVAVIAVALTAVLLRPKAKKPDALTQLENPTADAGMPGPIVFGTITVKQLNVLHFGDKWKESYKSSNGGGK